MDTQGTYGGTQTGTRAQACVMLVRIVEEGQRADTN